MFKNTSLFTYERERNIISQSHLYKNKLFNYTFLYYSNYKIRRKGSKTGGLRRIETSSHFFDTFVCFFFFLMYVAATL